MTNCIFCYLTKERFIARDVVNYFIKTQTLYENAKYHNCVFVGLDESGFHHNGESERLFIFEAPIDMLAFITLHRKDWRKHSHVALCSVPECALMHRLNVNPKLRKVVLCLDNDNEGISACEKKRLKTRQI